MKKKTSPTEIVIAPPQDLAPASEVERDRIAATLDASLSDATRRAYRSDAIHFINWCAERDVDYRKGGPELITRYLDHLQQAGFKAATITRRLTAISQAYQRANVEDPTRNVLVRKMLRGIRRTIGVKQNQKSPVTVERLQDLLSHVPDTLGGCRDRALLLLGFSGAFRRSELVAIRVEDLEFSARGVVVTIRKSKTDQEGKGRTVAVPFGNQGLCPVTSLQDWLSRAKITEGPLFRWTTKTKVKDEALTDQIVADIVKKYASLAGLEPERFAGHSLRAGLATSAAEAGASTRKIQEITGHASSAMVERYVREADKFTDNAAARVLKGK